MKTAGALAALIRSERAGLLAAWRAGVQKIDSARPLDTPTLNDHLPRLLDALALELAAVSHGAVPAAPAASARSPAHGAQRLRDGYRIDEVVTEYHVLRTCLLDLAAAHGVPVDGVCARTLHGALDRAIAEAVGAYVRERAAERTRQQAEYLKFLAHDLRSPLGAIVLAVDALEQALPEPTGDGALVGRMLRSLGRNVKQLEALVASVVERQAASATEAPPPSRDRAELRTLVRHIVQELEPMARTAGTRIVNQVPEQLFGYVDVHLLGRALRNLVINALEHAHGGEVTLAAEAHGDRIVCWVRDTGVGIAADQIPRLFDKAAGDAGEATATGSPLHGVGLAIVRKFVAAHGGTIDVESETGRGTTFRLELPGALLPDAAD